MAYYSFLKLGCLGISVQKTSIFDRRFWAQKPLVYLIVMALYIQSFPPLPILTQHCRGMEVETICSKYALLAKYSRLRQIAFMAEEKVGERRSSCCVKL